MPPARVVHAPGRVNLIGEHTDYNEGFVLPVAIDLGIALALVPTDDRRVEVTLAETGERDGFDLDAIGAKRSSWIDYVAGTAWALIDAGEPVRGFRAVLVSDLPQGSGLSSSAALELVSSLALSGGALPAVDRMTLARLAQRAENAYVGVNTGLMDQFASAFGEPGRALLLDCRSLEHRAVPHAARRGGARRLPQRLAAAAGDLRLQRASRPVRGRGRGRSPPSNRASPRCAT